MEKETITGDEMRAIVSKYTTIPAVNMDVVQAQKDGVKKYMKQPAATA